MNRKVTFSFVFIYACFAVISISLATITPILSLEQIRDMSQHIIKGEVLSINNSIVSKDKKLIFTSIQIKINKNYKGTIKPGTVIEIIRYGGVWPDGRKTFMVGAPHFEEKEEIILFLNEQIIGQNKTNYTITGLQQGKFLIKNGYIFRESQQFPVRFLRTNDFWEHDLRAYIQADRSPDAATQF